MGAQILGNSGIFFGGDCLWRGRGRGWVHVNAGYMCMLCAFCLCGCWGALFFAGGGGILLEGKGEWVMLLDNRCVVPSFVVFVKRMAGTFFLSGGRGGRRGGGLDK